MKKLVSTTLLLFVSSFISIIFNSCIKCGPFDSIEYEVDKITVQPSRILNYWDNESKNFDLLLDTFGLEKGVKFDSLALELDYIYKNYAVEVSLNYNVMPSIGLVACSPPEPSYDSPSELKITSDQDWDENTPAGTNLSGITKLVKDYYGPPVNYQNSISSNSWDSDLQSVIFSAKPTYAKTHTFTIKVKTLKGKEFTLVTRPILVLN